jgi:hypothetical protein
MSTINVVMSISHYQGARSYPIAIAPTAAVAEHIAGLLSTCSFCSPGRTRRYSTGSCYDASTMRVRPSVPVLPAEADEWTEMDARAWLGQEQDW